MLNARHSLAEYGQDGSTYIESSIIFATMLDVEQATDETV